MRAERLYAAVACALLTLSLGPLATSAFVLGFLHGESPCVLCWAQRTGMTLIALLAVFILRFGPRPRYVGLAVLVAAHGVYMAIRHSALHLARDVGQGFALEILGAHTYVWSGFIFLTALGLMGALLVLMPEGQASGAPREPGPLGRAAILVFLIAVAGNALQAFASTGPPPFVGQSDPVRFSWNPRRWVWSLAEWAPAETSWRGRWGIEKPSLARLDRDPRHAPLAPAVALTPLRELRVGVALDGVLTDFAYDAASDRFLLTTSAHGVYLLDGGLSRVLRHAVLDPGFSIDLSDLAGAAFVDSGTLAVLGVNKSYVLLREGARADEGANYRFFLAGFDQFEELARGRFATLRARMMYVMALAYDPSRDSFYTLTVPNRRHRRLVVSRFERADMTLAEEFAPRLSAGSGLAIAEQRSLDEYYVTGAVVDSGRLLALSAAYSSLLSVDLATREVVAAHVVDGLASPVGLAAKGQELWIAESDGRVVVVPRPTGSGEGGR